MFHARRLNWWLFLPITAAIALLWLLALMAFAGRFPIPQEPPFDSRLAAMARAWRAGPSGRLGANLDRRELAASLLEGRLTALEEGGFRWVRFTLPWDEIEPEQGELQWNEFDRVFAAFARHPELVPVIVLNRSPEWSRRVEDAGNPLAPPQERADFGAFAAAVASRYGDQIKYYQVWDEPNIAPHWGARPVNPQDYAGLLREGAVQVRAADPDAVILLAALAPTLERGGANLSDLDYLDALYRQNAQRWFDIVAAEPYGFSEPPSAASDVARLNFARAERVREVMRRHGQEGAPLWATAFGWNAPPAGWDSSTSPWGEVSEEQQASYAADALELAANDWGWMGPMLWAAACPPRQTDDPWFGFALCDAAGNPRGVSTALTEAAGQAPSLSPGDHEPDHPAIAYSPGWRVTALAADPGQSASSLSFPFHGTGAALNIEGGPYWAVLRVRVDGRPANALPRDTSGEAYVVLFDPLNESRVVPVARGLPPGEHMLELTTEGGWGQWALQGVRIYGQDTPDRSAWAWLLLGLAGLGTVIWVAVVFPSLAGRATAALDAASALPEPLYWVAAAVLLLLLLLGNGVISALASLAALGLLFLVRPDLCLPLIAFTLPFWPRPEALAGRQFSHYELLVWLGLLAMCVRFILEGKSAVRPPAGLDWPVMAVLAAGLAATLAAAHRDVALREFRTVLLDGALFYLLVTRVPPPKGQAFTPWPALDGLMLGAGAVSGLAMWQFMTGYGRIDVEGVWRVRAVYGSPNNLALYLGRIVPLAVAVASFGPARRRLAYGLAALAATAACLMTFSKGAWLLGLPVGLAFVLLGGAWRSGRRWPLAFLAALAALGAASVALAARTPRIGGLFNLRSGTTFLRLQLWQSAWRMGLDHPLFGVGPDNFLYSYRTRYVLPTAWEELNLSHPHNILLDIWTRLGLAGLVSMGWLLIAGWLKGWRLFRVEPGDIWPAALGLLGGLAAALAHGLIDNSFFLVDLMALLMLAIGIFQRVGHGSIHPNEAKV